MNIQRDLPARVNYWLGQAKQADQGQSDRDVRPDFVDYQGTPAFSQDRLLRARAQFDAAGTVQADLLMDAYEQPFYPNELTVQVRRQGDLEKVAVRSHHPRDPEMFDYRASYSRDVKSGEVRDYVFNPGPPQGLALVHEVLTNRECQINMGVFTGLGGVSGVITGAILGAPMGVSALAGAGLGLLAGYGFSVSQRAYGG